jgi:hypothetical protein
MQQGLTGPEFAALLARTEVSQAARPARLAGVTPRQVNKWRRRLAAVPLWVNLLAMFQDRSPEALTIALEEARRFLAPWSGL